MILVLSGPPFSGVEKIHGSSVAEFIDWRKDSSLWSLCFIPWEDGQVGLKILGKGKKNSMNLWLRQQSKSEDPQTNCCDDFGEPERDGFSSWKKRLGQYGPFLYPKGGGLNDSSETFSSSADWMHQRLNLSLLFLMRIMVFGQQKNHFRKIRLSTPPAGKRNLVPCRNSAFKHWDRFLFFSQEVFGKISQVSSRQMD